MISALFAAIHVQYDWFGILQVFLIGLLLGMGALAQRLDPAHHPDARADQHLGHGRDPSIKVEWLS